MSASRLGRFVVLVLALAITGCSSKDSPVSPPPPDPGGVVVSGVVRDTTGSPVADALVTLEPSTAGVPARTLRLLQGSAHNARDVRAGVTSRPASLSGSTASAPTDAHGAFSFAAVQAGEYLVSATSLHHLSDAKTITVPARPTGAPAETVIVQLQLQTIGTFTGIATLEGATDHSGTVVYVGGTSAVALTDASGAYALDDVPLGTWTVTAAHAGYLNRTTQGTLSQAGEQVALADLALPRDLNLPPTASMSVVGACALIPVHLTASASDPDGSVTLYEWDFEDDGTVDTTGATLTSVDHRYAVGDHRAKLIVTDDKGARGVAAANLTISGPPDTLYVSSSTGSSAGPGTRTSPFSTVGAAIGYAGQSPCPRTIRVAIGYYPESVRLESGLDLQGGFDAATWTHAPGAQTEIWVGSIPAEAAGVSNTTVSDFHFTAADMTVPSSSSVAFLISGCGPSLVFERCTFDARHGVDGIPGPAGTAGRDGTDGGSGSDEGGQGGSYGGGNGGHSLRGTSQVGAAGRSSTCATGGAGGTIGLSCAPTDSGQAGGAGGDGADGPNAPAAPDAGHLNGGKWVAAIGADGGDGCPGAGGGGGGPGLACQYGSGGGGGGGGGAGDRGTGGLGGRGGGGSIAMILNSASPRFESCRWTSLDGADGGPGGDGGAGGAGGRGGAGGNSGGTVGGAGGHGGHGGGGGGGQGGSGGPSWGMVLLAGSSPISHGSTFTIGRGGRSGPGGHQSSTGTAAPPGHDGRSGMIGP